MTHDDFVQFFRGLAQAHVDIASVNDDQFLNIDIFDTTSVTTKPSGLKWKTGKYALILEDFEQGLSETNQDQQYFSISGAFWIMAETGRDDATKRAAVKTGSLEVTKEVIAKMQEYSRDETEPYHWLKDLVDGSFMTQKLGPIWDNCYGWRTEFEVWIPANEELVVDSGKWD
jgi:hypothetical protein